MAYAPGDDIGTWKDCTRATVSLAVTGAGTTNVSLATLVPVGTKAAIIRIYITDATPGTESRVQETGTAVTEWSVIAQVANIANNGIGPVLLDANRTFDITNSAAFDTHQIYLVAYAM